MASYRALSCSQMVDGQQEETFPVLFGAEKIFPRALWGLKAGYFNQLLVVSGGRDDENN